MAVDPEITREHLRQELLLFRDIAITNRWTVVPDIERLTVVVTFAAHTGDLFVVEAACDNYREVPPLFEFIEPVSGLRGTRQAYPKTIDGFFHDSGPCICAPFNRKAYQSFVATGPHTDWSTGDWATSTASNVQWCNFSKLGDMFGLIHTRISRPDFYRGRMG